MHLLMNPFEKIFEMAPIRKEKNLLVLCGKEVVRILL